MAVGSWHLAVGIWQRIGKVWPLGYEAAGYEIAGGTYSAVPHDAD